MLELSLHRKKGQPTDTMMKRMSIHLKTLADHPEEPTDMHERY